MKTMKERMVEILSSNIIENIEMCQVFRVLHSAKTEWKKVENTSPLGGAIKWDIADELGKKVLTNEGQELLSILIEIDKFQGKLEWENWCGNRLREKTEEYYNNKK